MHLLIKSEIVTIIESRVLRNEFQLTAHLIRREVFPLTSCFRLNTLVTDAFGIVIFPGGGGGVPLGELGTVFRGSQARFSESHFTCWKMICSTASSSSPSSENTDFSEYFLSR